MRPATNRTRFTIGAVAAAWMVAYLVALVVQSVVVGASGNSGVAGELWPTWLVLASLVCLWVPFGGALIYVSSRRGTGDLRDDFKARFRLIDLVGLPIGALSQLVLVPLVYWPLNEWFPDTFSADKVEERARDLWQGASGAWLVGLIVAIAVLAPIVEEFVYRGMILQALQARLDDMLALVLSAAWFAVIHLTPVEFPGLFAFGLVLGVCFQRSGRLSMAIMAHIGFNAVGLAIAAGM